MLLNGLQRGVGLGSYGGAAWIHDLVSSDRAEQSSWWTSGVPTLFRVRSLRHKAAEEPSY